MIFVILLTLLSPKVFDYSVLGELKNLEVLRLTGNSIRNGLGWLTELRDLKALAIDVDRSMSLAPIADLPNLESLVLMLAYPADLAPITSAPLLQKLVVRTDQEVKWDAALPVPRKLRQLVISGGGIKGLEGLQGCRDLEILTISNSPVSDLSPISGMRNLGTIDLRGTKVDDLSVIGSLAKFALTNGEPKLFLTKSPALARYPSLAGLAAMTVGRDSQVYAGELASEMSLLLAESST